MNSDEQNNLNLKNSIDQQNQQTQNIIGLSSVGSGSNNDIANSILTNTLLSSMKTGQPLIDAITSLVFISQFRNPIFKNVSIVSVLVLGIIFHRITKSVDILNIIYETILSYYNPYTFIQYIPSKHLKNIILKYNGDTLTLKIENKQTFFDIKNQYNLLTMLNKVIEKYPDIQRETLEFSEIIGINNPNLYIQHSANLYKRLKSSDSFINYTDFETKEQNKKACIKIILENLTRNPPKSGKWYNIDDDIQFNWTIIRPHIPLSSGSSGSSGSGSGSSGSSKLIESSYYILNIKSHVKSTEELQKYLEISRKELLDKLVVYEEEEEKQKQSVLNSINNKDFIGHIFEVTEETKIKDSSSTISEDSDKKKQYNKDLINTFCRPLESIFFKEKEQLLNILGNFKLKSGIYEKLPHRHKIGILIYGKPGAGKSSLSVAIATELKRNIIRVSLKDKSLDDSKLSYILNNFKKGYVIILDELDTHKSFRPRNAEEDETRNSYDISDNSSISDDSYEGIGHDIHGHDIHGHGHDINGHGLNGDDDLNEGLTNQNPSKHRKEGPVFGINKELLKFCKNKRFNKGWTVPDKLTLGCFLEAMDGISSTEERVVIAMTNHPKLLDPAILRPGRFDIVINMDSLDNQYMKMYLMHIFKDFKISENEIDEACCFSIENKVSTSSIEQACIEKYSVNEAKTLKMCIKNVHESFIF